MTDLETLAAHALQRAGDPDCPVPEASLWLSIATDIEDYVSGEMLCATTLFGEVPGVETGRMGDVSETAPSVTSTPPLAPRLDRSTLMKSSASHATPRPIPGGGA